MCCEIFNTFNENDYVYLENTYYCALFPLQYMQTPRCGRLHYGRSLQYDVDLSMRF